MKTQKHKIILLLFLFLSISATLFAKITKGPYLTAPEKNSMTIMWECDNNNSAEVVYWQQGEKVRSKEVAPFDSVNGLYLYRVKLTDLKTNQKYNYKIIADKDTSVSYFITNPPKGVPFTFVAIGDSRSNHDVFKAISDDVNKLSPRLVINMGDLVRDGRKFTDWSPHFFKPSKEVINHIPHISTLGDHETAGHYNGYSFYYYFRNGKSVDKMWFSYDFGDVHFISLDYRGENDREMIEWFKNDVKNSDAKWKIVYLHRPTYNLGGHRTHWGGKVWTELYRKNKIDIVFAGHSHIYERFYPLRPSNDKTAWPVTFITTGGAGAGLYDAVQNECAAVSKSVNHYNLISVSGDTLKYKSFQLDGKVLDNFEIVKHNGKYSDEYLGLVKPQDVMDTYMTFAGKLLLKFDSIPTKEVPAKKSLSFNGSELLTDVPFKVVLSKESSKHYRMEPLEGILKRGEEFKGMILLYAKNEIKQKGIFLDPPLLLNAYYIYNGKKYIAYGEKARSPRPHK